MGVKPTLPIFIVGMLSALLVTLFFVAFSAPLRAEVYKPDPKTVIASWPSSANDIMTPQQASSMLNDAATLYGSDRQRREVERTVNTLLSSDPASPQLQLLQARILQQQHQFEDAKNKLITLTNSQPSALGPALLLASVYVNLGEFEKAQTTCKSLLSQSDYLTSFTCLLNARFQQNPDEAIYQQLSDIRQLRKPQRQQIALWVDETLAAMAYTLDMPEQALLHLGEPDFSSAPLSRIALWADIMISLNRASQVIERLQAHIPEDPSSLDDVILIKLAEAEKQTDSTDRRWQDIAKERIALREWREDSAHAGHVAYYYLTIHYNPDKALHFAKLNWKKARSYEDKALLTRALLAKNNK